MNIQAFAALVGRELDNCIGLPGERLSRERDALKNAYFGAAYPVDAERARSGWSTYVDRSVLETVEWAKGPLLKIFAGSGDLVRFEPRGPEEAHFAREATAYVNREVFGRNAFEIVYGPLTDGLYQRAGWAKVYFDDRVETTVLQELDNLSAEEAEALAALEHLFASDGAAEDMEEGDSEGFGKPADDLVLDVEALAKEAAGPAAGLAAVGPADKTAAVDPAVAMAVAARLAAGPAAAQPASEPAALPVGAEAAAMPVAASPEASPEAALAALLGAAGSENGGPVDGALPAIPPFPSVPQPSPAPQYPPAPQPAWTLPDVSPSAPRVRVEVEKRPGDGAYRVRVVRERREGRIRILPLPSERVVLSRDALSVESARFIAHWEDRYAGELLAEGYDPLLVDSLHGDDEAYPETETGRAVNSDNTEDFLFEDAPALDDLLAEAWSGNGGGSGGESYIPRRSLLRLVRVYEAWLTVPAGLFPDGSLPGGRSEDPGDSISDDAPSAESSSGDSRSGDKRSGGSGSGDSDYGGKTPDKRHPHERPHPHERLHAHGRQNPLRRLKIVFARGEGGGTPGSGGRGIVILDVEEWTMGRPPLFAACSLPLPYAPVGLCLADLVTDLQKVRTEMMRETLDGMYLANHGELHINQADPSAEINFDQFLNRSPGGAYMTRGSVSITPLPVSPDVAAAALEGLRLTDKAKEQRTGIGLSMQGLSADVLQNTATGASILEEAQNIRLEMIARVFAETFFKPLAGYALALARRYLRNPSLPVGNAAVASSLVPAGISSGAAALGAASASFGPGGFGGGAPGLAGSGYAGSSVPFVTLRPECWDPDMAVSVVVGLGAGSRQKQAAALHQLLGVQEKLLTSMGKDSPVRLAHVIRLTHKLAETLGIEAPEQYFGSVEEAEVCEQRIMQAANTNDGGPEAALLQAQREAEKERLRLQREMETQKLLLQRQAEEQKLQMQQRADEQRLALHRQEAADKLLVERARAEAELRNETAKFRSNMLLKAAELRQKGRLSKRQMELEARLDAIRATTETLPKSGSDEVAGVNTL